MDGGLSTAVAALVGLLLASYLALYPALFAVLTRCCSTIRLGRPVGAKLG
jgi:apolipoprotein N-acyltransferase